MPAAPATAVRRILVVDDEEAIRVLLSEVLARAGYGCETAESGETAQRMLAETKFDAVITDMRMGGMSGLDLLRFVRRTCDSDVIVLTAFASDWSYEKLVEEGAAEFVLKPCRPAELVTRVRRVLAQRSLRQDRDRAEQELKLTLASLREAYLDTIRRLSIATEYKDVDTGSHIERMGRMSALLGEAVGFDPAQVDDIRYGAPMHDVGKIGIPDSILLKPGRLTDQEFEIMKTHTEIGASILVDPKSSILVCAREIALTHHEQWDGGGYPRGLRGDETPIAGRIVKLADVFDALVSARPYKQPYPVKVAAKLIRSQSGTHFDPALVDVFLSRLDDLLALRAAAGAARTATGGDVVWSERDGDSLLKL